MEEIITGAVALVLGILGAYAKTRKYRRMLEAVILGVNAAVIHGEDTRVKHHIRRQSIVDNVQDALHHEVRRVEAREQ